MNVLVELEVPKSCEECPFAYITEGVSHDYCQYVGYETDIKDFTGSRCNERPRWCPFNYAKEVVLSQEVDVDEMTQMQDQDAYYVSLAAREESEAAAKHDYDFKKKLRREKAKEIRRTNHGN